MSPPLVYTIVLNYNGKDVLPNCLESLSRSAYPNAVTLLVDNASKDGSVEEAETRFPGIEVIRNDRNHFFSQGNNIGIAHALAKGADYVFVLNNDTVVDPACIGTLVEFMEGRGKAGACQPLLCYMDRPDLVASAGCRLGIVGKAWDDACGEPVARFGTEPRQVLAATGGALLLRAAAIRRVGMFCERFEMYFEDVDLGLRLREAGYEVFCVPEARVLHELSATTNRIGSWRRSYYCERNSYWVMLRNYPLAKILKGFALGVPAALLVSAYNLYKGNRLYAWCIMKALLVGLGTFVVQFPRRCLEGASSGRRYPFWAMLDERVVYPPAARRPRPEQR